MGKRCKEGGREGMDRNGENRGKEGGARKQAH